MAFESFAGSVVCTYDTVAGTGRTIGVLLLGDNQSLYSLGTIIFHLPPDASNVSIAGKPAIAASAAPTHPDVGSAVVEAFLTSVPGGAPQAVTVTWHDSTTATTSGFCPSPMLCMGPDKG